MGLTVQPLGLLHYVVTAIKISLSALLPTYTEEEDALATLPYAYFSSVLAFKSHLKSHLKISL